MAKVHYVTCPACRDEYYLDQSLYDAIQTNPRQKLVCPYCKKEFHPAPPPK